MGSIHIRTFRVVRGTQTAGLSPHLLTLIVEENIQFVSYLLLSSKVLALSRLLVFSIRSVIPNTLAIMVMPLWTTVRTLFLTCVVLSASALPVELSRSLGRVCPPILNQRDDVC